MKHQQIQKIGTGLVLFTLLFGMFSVQPVQAHVYYKLLLKINVTTSASMNDSSIETNMDTVNKIFGQCKIRFNVILIERNVEGSATNYTEEAKLEKKMQDDLKKKPFNGRGGGITITGGPIGGDNDTNGQTWVGDMTTTVVLDGTDGETWAHELGHGLGLKHNKNDTDGDGFFEYDPDGDGSYNNVLDQQNIMWPFKNERSGTKFSEIQCKKMQSNALKYGIGGFNFAQFGSIGNDSILDGLTYIWNKDNISDTTEDPGIDWDLYKTLLNSTEPFEYFTIKWSTSKAVNKSDTLDTYLSLGIDSDNNNETGLEFANVTGVDKIYQVWLYGENMTNFNSYSYLTYTMGEGGGDIDANITVGETTTSKDFNDAVNITEVPVSTYVQATLRWDDLDGSLNGVPAVSVIEDFAGNTVTSNNGTFYNQPFDTPRIYVNSMQVWDNMDLTINGTGYTPNSDATIFFDDYIELPITIGSDGTFEYTIKVTNIPLGTYFLEVIDDEGNLAIVIMDVIEDPNPPTTTDSSSTSTSTTTSTTNPTTSSSSTKTDDNTDNDGATSGLISIAIMPIITMFSVIVLIQRRWRQATN